jgi:hypothetical protein
MKGDFVVFVLFRRFCFLLSPISVIERRTLLPTLSPVAQPCSALSQPALLFHSLILRVDRLVHGPVLPALPLLSFSRLTPLVAV